ncbi:MAG: TrmH family RNA methyltransferase [Acidimicrobiales bacterium]
MSGAGTGGRGPLSPTDLKRLHRTWRRSVDLRLGLILDGVQNPYNVGSLLRSAAAYHVEALWLVPPAPDPSHSGVAKTALGSHKLVSWHRAESGPEAVAAARAQGFTTVAIELTADAEPLFAVELGPAVCFVLGHEDRGVHRETLAAVDRVAFLPQLGKVGSLNVSQAGTVALYEALRQAAPGRPSASPPA